jgi:hypothetical protein
MPSKLKTVFPVTWYIVVYEGVFLKSSSPPCGAIMDEEEILD